MSRRTRRRSTSFDSKPVKQEREITNEDGDEGMIHIVAGGEEEEEEGEEGEEEEEGDDADEEDEDGEITRCICKQDELHSDTISPEFAQFLKKNYKISIDQGLFISCEKCGVWQHGYCVGLFTNDDVPDLYWCELCKPGNHLFVKANGYPKRTLYKPVNDKRKKIELFGLGDGVKVDTQDSAGGSNKRRRVDRGDRGDRVSPPATAATEKEAREAMTAAATAATSTTGTDQNKDRRKDRRTHHHHSDEDEYDKQLQKALRESAKESGLPIDESDTTSATGAVANTSTATGHYSPRKRSSRGASGVTSEADNDSSIKREYEEYDSETGGSTAGGNKSATSSRGTDARKSRSKSKKRRDVSSSNTSLTGTVANAGASAGANSNSTSATTSTTAATAAQANKDELIQAPYKPRYVSSQSSIYDLRKRTSAIIEWIARTQYDLQQERNYKFELFSFTPDSEAIAEEKQALEASYNEKLLMIDDLQRKINEWEIQFGKYAP
ncbi:CTI6 [Candida margitis]|uniref:CTI6 n=1 Tax=Candida margitis TaxID=1775924 RepID=UPI0022268A5F|nr:CTI6 [Candida margitis]KAI5949841.1 CTI6 [Candida margitis]